MSNGQVVPGVGKRYDDVTTEEDYSLTYSLDADESDVERDYWDFVDYFIDSSFVVGPKPKEKQKIG